ncbi:MAG: aminomethyl-transferring glycine dehydrogenase subunit GcvPA [Thermodesulfobacteriota bacterium]
MRYLPHTPEDVAAMLSAIGLSDLDDLFSMVPPDCRWPDDLNLPPALSELELIRHLSDLADRSAQGYKVFLGAGRYEHFVPETVRYLLGRSEFSTAYTPYQPELSQGTLQAIYEYQTLIARLLGLDVANASLYDGATALAEALFMAVRITRRTRVALSRAIHPAYRQVVKTYFRPTGYEVIELPYGSDGRTDLTALEGGGGLAAVAVQSPNFFGCIEDLPAASDLAHRREALMVATFTEALAYGWLKNPGGSGADIACGEGQSLGLPRGFGGPGLGLFACRNQFVRNMPGRLVGQTQDLEGRRGFVLTLATREQHIRREKAVSNICTNNSLCALTAAMFLASAGSQGLKNMARLNYDKSEYLKNRLDRAGLAPSFSAPTFNEFVFQGPGDAGFYRRLLDKGMAAGLPLGTWYPELEGHFLICVTEVKTRSDLDHLVEEMIK